MAPTMRFWTSIVSTLKWCWREEILKQDARRWYHGAGVLGIPGAFVFLKVACCCCCCTWGAVFIAPVSATGAKLLVSSSISN